MINSDKELLNNLRVGIVGCGHLGQAIAQSLLDHGFEKRNLLISYGGNPLTYKKLDVQGLSSCLAANERIFREADLVFITLKPQDIMGMKEITSTGKALIVSCMAGIPASLLYRVLGTRAYRMMFSGPDTIVSGKGVATMYPEHKHLKLLLHCMNLMYIKITTEDDLDVFTAGVCMPAAIIKAESPIQQQIAIDRIRDEHPLLSELYTWASNVLPPFQNGSDKEAYVSRMITKGGVTEAIITSLFDGAPLDAALRKGIGRTKEISEEIQRSIVNHVHGISSHSLSDLV